MHGSKAALMKFLFNFMVQLGKLIKGLYVPKRKSLKVFRLKAAILGL